MKILIVEDDPGIIEVVGTAFELGYAEADFIAAETGQSGVEAAEKEKPDVILLDLGLPDISGFEVLKKIRTFSSVPVIVLTVRSEEADVVRALTYGADDYMVKPFRQMELIARVKAVSRRLPSVEAKQSVSAGPLHFGLSIT